MKTLLIGSLALASLLTIYIYFSENAVGVLAKTTKAKGEEILLKKEIGIEELKDSIEEQKNLLLKAQLKVKRIEEFQAGFTKLSNHEIEKEIELKQKILSAENLIGKANSNNLDEKSSMRLVEVMRQNQALNIVLLERKLKRFERNYL